MAKSKSRDDIGPTIMVGDLRALVDDNDRLRAENERMRQAFAEVLEKLKMGREILLTGCDFCGSAWPKIDGQTREQTVEASRQHAESCEANPVLQRAKAAEADIHALRGVLISAIDEATSFRMTLESLRALRADVNGPNWRERIKERA